MRQILDLHIHSRYSRACARDLDLAGIDKACRIKGIDIVATGDFTYPAYLDSIHRDLKEIPACPGLYRLRSAPDDTVKFILGTEVALIYKKGGKCRRVHMCLLAPELAAAAELQKALDHKFNVRSDGRPILGMSIEELFVLALKIHPFFLFFPAHIWTPWFSIFGSKSGFDSLEEAFGDQLEHLYAYETGLSSDAAMNWRLSALDRLTMLSNSDAHSLPNLGREANIWEMEQVSYDIIYQAIKNKDTNVIKKTIEFFPEEGMYHYDGHRECGVVMAPADSRRQKGLCPKCARPLVLGVEYRVEELADRPVDFCPAGAPGFVKLVELDKIVAAAMNIKTRSSRKVQAEYQRMIGDLGPELPLLLECPDSALDKLALPRVAEGIRRVRSGQLRIEPGFDGQYGLVKIFEDKDPGGQTSLILT